jgi:hypothetical protein
MENSQFRTAKSLPTEADFKARQEYAIQQIKDKTFFVTKNETYCFTEKELREEFEFDDLHKVCNKFDNVFTDANFILYPMDKVIEV